MTNDADRVKRIAPSVSTKSMKAVVSVWKFGCLKLSGGSKLSQRLPSPCVWHKKVNAQIIPDRAISVLIAYKVWSLLLNGSMTRTSW